MGCLISQLAAKFAFFPPTPPTYQVKKSGDGKLVAVSTTSSLPIAIDDSFLDVLVIQTKRGNKIVAFYLRNPYARLTVLYSHGNAADLGQLYDLFVQLKANLRVNLIGSVLLPIFLLCSWSSHFQTKKIKRKMESRWSLCPFGRVDFVIFFLSIFCILRKVQAFFACAYIFSEVLSDKSLLFAFKARKVCSFNIFPLVGYNLNFLFF